MQRRPWAAAIAAAGLSLLATEVAMWQASRRNVAATPQPGSAPPTLIVLGCPSRKESRVSPVQAWRVAIAARNWHRSGRGQLIFTGGRTRGAARSEAAVMADHAHHHFGVPRDAMALEEQALTTWDNVALTVPRAESETLAFISDPLHAARARRYALRQHPSIGARLVPVADYRPLERWWLKVPLAGYELFRWIMGRTNGPADAMLGRVQSPLITPSSTAAGATASSRAR